MDKRIKRRWVAALRSGKFKQGKHTLRTEDGKYCCLGVLCELHRRSTKGKWDNEEGGSFYIDSDTTLPEVVQKWAGLSEDNPNCGNRVLSSWNDGNDTSRAVGFSRIATLIEKHL